MRAKPCKLGGIIYPSVRAAARALGVNHKTLAARLDPEHARTLQRNWHQNNREKSRALRRRLAGKPLPTRSCPAECEICREAFKRTPALDHDHKTGAFRGWLCSRCNTALGLFRDSPKNLLRAMQYLLEDLL